MTIFSWLREALITWILGILPWCTHGMKFLCDCTWKTTSGLSIILERKGHSSKNRFEESEKWKSPIVWNADCHSRVCDALRKTSLRGRLYFFWIKLSTWSKQQSTASSEPSSHCPLLRLLPLHTWRSWTIGHCLGFYQQLHCHLYHHHNNHPCFDQKHHNHHPKKHCHHHPPKHLHHHGCFNRCFPIITSPLSIQSPFSQRNPGLPCL